MEGAYAREQLRAKPTCARPPHRITVQAQNQLGEGYRGMVFRGVFPGVVGGRDKPRGQSDA